MTMASNLPSLLQDLVPLVVIDVRDPGDIGKERLLMKATSDVDLSEFIIVPANRSGPSGIMNYNRLLFWFPKRYVYGGEYIRLYTRAGGYNVVEGRFGKEMATFHNFYWGLPRSIWTGFADTTAVIRISTWISKQVI